MKQSIDSFLNTIPPADRVALLTAPLSSVRTDPTTPAEVRLALAKVAGHGAPIPTDDAGLQRYQNDVACRTRETLEALRSLLSSLTGASIPPTMIFFSAGISATTRTTGNLGTSNCDLSTDAFQNVGAAAAAARAHVYVVQADLTPAQRSEGLENLAGVTGAQVMMLATTGENGLNRIAIETSASYLAAFDPEPSERNGQPHRLEVRVTRPDVTVRAGTQIAIARADGKNARKGAVSPRDMLREATVFRDLPLRVAAFPSREAADKLKLVALGELVDPSAKLTGAVIGVYDTKGKLIGAVDGAARVPRDDAADVCGRRSARHVPGPPRGDRRLGPQRNGGLRDHGRPHLGRRPEAELPASRLGYRRVQAPAAVQGRTVGNGDVRAVWQAARAAPAQAGAGGDSRRSGALAGAARRFGHQGSRPLHHQRGVSDRIAGAW